MGRRDVLVAFDYRRYQQDTVRLAVTAKEQGATLIAFTDPYLSPLSAHADVILTTSVRVAVAVRRAHAGASRWPRPSSPRWSTGSARRRWRGWRATTLCTAARWMVHALDPRLAGGLVTTEAAPLALIDHHVHGAVTEALDRAGFAALLSEGTGRRRRRHVDVRQPARVRACGAGARRCSTWSRRCRPSSTCGAAASSASAEVNQRMLRAAGVEAWLVDTGYQSDRIQDLAQIAEASGAPAHGDRPA